MLKLDLYIHSTGSVVPEGEPDVPVLKLLAKEPDYTGVIPPMQLRRMSKVIRMGIGAAKACMDAAGIDRPDALSVGTAFGCLQDTEIFLSKMIGQQEKMLTPTSFIQSTHNTVAGQIALLAGCHGHNMTYVHGGHSFEHAIINAGLYLQDHPGERVLAGGIDELTPTSHALMQRAGAYSEQPLPPASLERRASAGTVAGEGASFFLVSRERQNAKLLLAGIHLFEAENAAAALKAFRALQPELPAATLVILGNGGSRQQAPFYDELSENIFSGATVRYFKQHTGEYPTAVAYGLALAAGQDFEPDAAAASGQILLINHYCGQYAVWELERL